MQAHDLSRSSLTGPGSTVRVGDQPPTDHVTEQPSAQPVERVDKAWGHEETFAIVESSYAGKTLHVAGGESLSLQWHRDKDETIAVLSGRVEFDIGMSEDGLARSRLHRARRCTCRRVCCTGCAHSPTRFSSRLPLPSPVGGRTSYASRTATAAAVP